MGDNSIRHENSVIAEVIDKVLLLKINRPEQANAINRDVIRRLREEFDKAEWNDAIAVIILTGEGEKAFCAGLDLKERRSLSQKEALIDREKNMVPFFRKLQNFSKPIIGAINGPAIGGGAELALICDIRIGTVAARFGQGEIKWGMIPSMGAIQRLRLIVGMSRAKELILTGKNIEAIEAERYGIYNCIAEKGRLIEKALSVATEIASNSPIAVKQAKRALDIGADIQMAMFLDFELSKECFFRGEAFAGPAKFGK